MIGSWKIRPWLMRLFLPKYNEDKIIKFAPRCKFWIAVELPTTQERGSNRSLNFHFFKCATITLKFIQFRKQLVSKCDGKKKKKNPSLLRLSASNTLTDGAINIQLSRCSHHTPSPRHSRLWATPDFIFPFVLPFVFSPGGSVVTGGNHFTSQWPSEQELGVERLTRCPAPVLMLKDFFQDCVLGGYTQHEILSFRDRKQIWTTLILIKSV